VSSLATPTGNQYRRNSSPASVPRATRVSLSFSSLVSIALSSAIHLDGYVFSVLVKASLTIFIAVSTAR
jgi:hypothetical protein